MSSDVRVPSALRVPVVALAGAIEAIPAPGALPGGARYEPKWDGWRATIVRDGTVTDVLSRRGTSLTEAFADVATAAAKGVPAGCVLDGELVVWAQDRLDFTALSRRLATTGAARRRLVRSAPASYVAFDMLALDGKDVRSWPFDERRAALEHLAGSWSPPLNLSPLTADHQVAQGWFTDMAAAGIEGLVVKGGTQRYRAGARDWLKVKHRESLEVVCAAVIGPVKAPTVVVAGLPLDGELRIVGRTVPLGKLEERAVAAAAVPAAGPHPWPKAVTSATVNGFGGSREPVTLTLVEPFVVEVSADAAWSGRSFRHPLRLVRVRPDVEPGDVVMPEHLT